MSTPSPSDMYNELSALLEAALDKVFSFDQFPPGPLFHYGDAGAFLGVIEKRSIWATDYRYLNDKDEMVGGERIVDAVTQERLKAPNLPARHRAILERFHLKHSERSLTKTIKVFVSSFSTNGNQLSQWRSYGGDGSGYSIGIKGLKFDPVDPANSDMTVGLYACTYGATAFASAVEAAIDRVLRDIDSACALSMCRDHLTDDVVAQVCNTHLLRAMVALVPRYKHQAFHEEQEWRLVAFPHPGKETSTIEFRQCSRRGIVPYIPVRLCPNAGLLDLARVFVGPTQDETAGVETARLYLKKKGYSNVAKLVEAAGIPYRGW